MKCVGCQGDMKEYWLSNICPACCKEMFSEELQGGSLYRSVMKEMYFKDWKEAI